MYAISMQVCVEHESSLFYDALPLLYKEVSVTCVCVCAHHCEASVSAKLRDVVWHFFCEFVCRHYIIHKIMDLCNMQHLYKKLRFELLDRATNYGNTDKIHLCTCA